MRNSGFIRNVCVSKITIYGLGAPKCIRYTKCKNVSWFSIKYKNPLAGMRVFVKHKAGKVHAHIKNTQNDN